VVVTNAISDDIRARPRALSIKTAHSATFRVGRSANNQAEPGEFCTGK